MSLAALLARSPELTIEHLGTTSTDSYGNAVATVVATSTAHVYVEQTTAREVIVDQETYISDHLAVMSEDVVLNPADRILSPSGPLEVIGRPWPVFNPRLGVTSHIEANLRLVQG